MERNQAGLLVDGDVQGGDVGEPDKHLGVVANDVVVEAVDDPRGPVATRAGKDAVDLRIGERSHQFFEPRLVAASEVVVRAKQIVRLLDLEAHLFEPLGGKLHPLAVERTGRSHDGDRIARLERFCLQHFLLGNRGANHRANRGDEQHGDRGECSHGG